MEIAQLNSQDRDIYLAERYVVVEVQIVHVESTFVPHLILLRQSPLGLVYPVALFEFHPYQILASQPDSFQIACCQSQNCRIRKTPDTLPNRAISLISPSPLAFYFVISHQILFPIMILLIYQFITNFSFFVVAFLM